MQIVIPMAGDSKRFKEYGFDQPKYLIEVVGKTLLERSLSSLPLHLATKLIFIYKKEHEEQYNVRRKIIDTVSDLNHNSPLIETVLLDFPTRGQAETVLLAKDKIDPEQGLIIFNADTQFEYDWNDVDFEETGSWKGLILAVQKEGVQWSFAKVGEDGFVKQTAEKERISDNALVGFYHFTRAADFLETAQHHIVANIMSRGEFYVAPMYNDLIYQGKNFVLDIVKSFTPLGTPEEVFDFIKSQAKPTKPRSFNTIKIEEQTIIKFSKDKFKMGAEFIWLEQMNQHFFLKKYVPKQLALTHSYFKMEQVASPSLSEIFLYKNLTPVQINKIFEKLFQVMFDFKSFNSTMPLGSVEVFQSFWSKIYVEKTNNRIKEIINQVLILKDLLNGDFKVNKNKVINVNIFEQKIIGLIKELVDGLIPAYFHGDYCLPNILYSLEYDVVKLIDPRGELVGDQRYDLAKLRHSFSGYDLIINDYYELKEINKDEFEYNIFWNHNINKKTLALLDEKIIEYTSLQTFRQILIIEALLFLTMIPLHDEDSKRQKMFYILAMEKFTQLTFVHESV